jgi:hypothetical protein
VFPSGPTFLQVCDKLNCYNLLNLVVTCELNDHLNELGVNEEIILQWVLNKNVCGLDFLSVNRVCRL